MTIKLELYFRGFDDRPSYFKILSERAILYDIYILIFYFLIMSFSYRLTRESRRKLSNHINFIVFYIFYFPIDLKF